MEGEKTIETRNIVLDDDDVDLDTIERSLHSISLNTCYNNPHINDYIEKYKQDDFDNLENNLKQVLYDFHMDEKYHIYFIDMIRHHVHKDFDDHKIIRDNPIVLDYLNMNDDYNAKRYVKQKQTQENTFKLYDWNNGVYKKETI